MLDSFRIYLYSLLALNSIFQRAQLSERNMKRNLPDNYDPQRGQKYIYTPDYMSFIQKLITQDSSVPGAVPARVLEVDQTDSPCLMLLTHLVCCAENF